MNKQGQTASVGLMISLFVGIIVVMALLTGAIFPAIGTMTNTVVVANESLGATTVNNTAQYLTSYKVLTDVVVYNQTGTLVIAAGNYTITNNVVNNGAEAVKITPSVDAAAYLTKWKVSGTAQPLTYAANAGARSMIGLIAIFAALAVGVFAISPTLREKLFDVF